MTSKTDDTIKLEQISEAMADLERKVLVRKSDREQQVESMLTEIAKLGGKLTAEEDIIFQGTKLILPETMELGEAIRFLDEKRSEDERTMQFSRTFNYRPWDGAHATMVALKKAFGAISQQSTKTFFGEDPPQLITINTSPTETTQAPWGRMTVVHLPGLSLYLGDTHHAEFGTVFLMIAEGPRKYRHHVEGIFRLVEEELEGNSIYRGKPFDGQSMPQFLDLSGVDPSKVVYSEATLEQLEANVWSVLRWPDVLQELGMPLKRAVLLEGPYGTGKQQPVSEPILTPEGWVPIGTIRPGDKVIAVDGQPTDVLGVFPQTDRRTLKVTMADGAWTRCSPDHLWEVEQGPGKWNTKVLTTEEIIALGLRNKYNQRQFRIPTVAPVQYPEADLPVDPYALGVILGDGYIFNQTSKTTGGHVQITTDKEIIDTLAVKGTVGWHESPGIACFSTGAYAQGLVSLGLEGKRSQDKFIPEQYLRGSVNQRRALLAGLFDTDGSPNHTGGVEFNSTSQPLAEGIIDLVEGLGGTASRIATRQTYYTYKGKSKPGRVSFRTLLKVDVQPFRLLKKMTRWVAPTQRPAANGRYLDSIERVADEDSVCIKVAHERELYVTRSHIVTHNTLAAYLTAKVAVENGWSFLLCRPGQDDLMRVMQTARLYQPAVVFFEDVDSLAGAEKTIPRLLDIFDGIKSKGTRIVCVLTTNHAEQIHKAMIRPGRLDAVIHVGALDASGLRRLVEAVVPEDLLDPAMDWDAVCGAMEGFLPAFAKEAIDRAMRYNVARNQGKTTELGTQDFVGAAEGLRPQLELMEEAKDHVDRPRLEGIYHGLLSDVVKEHIHGADVVDLDGDTMYNLSLNGR